MQWMISLQPRFSECPVDCRHRPPRRRSRGPRTCRARVQPISVPGQPSGYSGPTRPIQLSARFFDHRKRRETLQRPAAGDRTRNDRHATAPWQYAAEKAHGFVIGRRAPPRRRSPRAQGGRSNRRLVSQTQSSSMLHATLIARRKLVPDVRHAGSAAPRAARAMRSIRRGSAPRRRCDHRVEWRRQFRAGPRLRDPSRRASACDAYCPG